MLATAAGCKNRSAANENDTARHAADTTVTERKVQDTTIVTHDTVVRSDTVKKKSGTVDRDTVKKP
jgi:hypothetical protein